MTYDEALKELSETFYLTPSSIETILIDAGQDFLSYEDEVSGEEVAEMYQAIVAHLVSE